MIRDRLKKAARKAAIRLLNMEFDTEDRDPNARGNPDASKFDPDKIPPLVDGDGDTPGPNHKQDIGRTWVAASSPAAAPCRRPSPAPGMHRGILPGAHVLPGPRLRASNAPRQRDPSIYDQTGDLGVKCRGAADRAGAARRLRGGFAVDRTRRDGRASRSA